MPTEQKPTATGAPPRDYSRQAKALDGDLRAVLQHLAFRGAGGMLVAEGGITREHVDLLGARVVLSAPDTDGEVTATLAPDLAAKQIDDLRGLSHGPRYLDGSTTIRKLRTCGYIDGRGPYTITPAGHARLEVL